MRLAAGFCLLNLIIPQLNAKNPGSEDPGLSFENITN